MDLDLYQQRQAAVPRPSADRDTGGLLGLFIIRFNLGTVVDEWNIGDLHTDMRQLGLFPVLTTE